MSVFDLPRDEFMAMLPELEQQGFDTYDLLRRYREHNSVFSGAHRAAGDAAQSIEGDGRRPVVGGLFSKERGTTGRNALSSMRLEPRNFLANVLSGGARAVEAPSAAAEGLIPQGDMAIEALGTAGMAMVGGGAMTRPRGSVGMGGRVAADALPEPRNAAERMARDILDMRAAGRARNVTDDMMAQADPQYMFNNTPLPMDEASRMARAGEMGFDTDQRYHGSGADRPIDNFNMAYAGSASEKPNERAVFTSDNPRVANFFSNYTADSSVKFGPDGPIMGQVLPVTSRGAIAREDWGGGMYDGGRMEAELRSAGGQGLDRLNIFNMKENLDGYMPLDNQIAVFDPRNIRSRFARFDPEFAHLSNLSAANASAAGGAAAMAAQGHPTTRRRRNVLREMLR